MKYYKQNNEVFAYEEDGSQDHLIGDKAPMTAEEVEAHINPPKTVEQILAEKIAEAKAYLANTDFKMTVDYYSTMTAEQQEELSMMRSAARTFLKEQGL